MKAIVFDIDGTLIDSMFVEPALYFAAIRSVLGPVRIRPNLDDYYHVTDSGMLAEILDENGFSQSADAPRQIQDLFVSKLREFISSNGPFRPISGAIQFFDRVRRCPDTRLAIATGSWRDSAVLKLETAGFDIDGVPLASCDDGHSRTEIMSAALSVLENGVDSITYFGDAEWDRRACDELGWGFVAVGSDLGGVQSFEGFEI